jgi:hypothetical protein
VRAQTEALCAPLETEDYVVSSMPDVSPTKWHLAHTSWFFETFVLAPHDAGLRAARPALRVPVQLVLRAGGRAALPRAARARHAPDGRRGVRLPRARRRACARLLAHAGDDPAHPAAALVELGLHHEQQHQELLVTDIKHVFWMNPLRPAYLPAPGRRRRGGPRRAAVALAPGGHDGIGRAPHRARRARASRSTTRGRAPRVPRAVPARVAAGDQRRVPRVRRGRRLPPPDALAVGRVGAVRRSAVGGAALLGARRPDGWTSSRSPARAARPGEPVCHVSYYEADAFARWAGAPPADRGGVGGRARARHRRR